MNVTIVANVAFQFTLKRIHIDLLCKLSEMHYDARCREASRHDEKIPYEVRKEHNFLACWRNQIYNWPQDSILEANWRQMDLSLKIMEVLSLRGLEPTEINALYEVRRTFIQSMQKSRGLFNESYIWSDDGIQC